MKIINNGLLSGQKARQFYTHKKRVFFIQERVLFVYFCLHLFGYITAMRKEVDKYGSSMGQNHLLIDFVKNLFPKFKQFDWLIAKLVLILANKISF